MKNCLVWPLRWQRIHILEHLPSTVCWLHLLLENGGGFIKDFFVKFSSRKIGGEMMQFDEIIFFQMGWFKYQLVMVCPEKWWLKRQPGKKGAMDLFERLKGGNEIMIYIYVCLSMIRSGAFLIFSMVHGWWWFMLSEAVILKSRSTWQLLSS